MIYRSKYPIVLALLLAAGLSGCINDNYLENPSNNRPVVFSAQVSHTAESRALTGHPIENISGQTDAAQIPEGKSFGVYAWVKETTTALVDNFTELQNMAVTYDGAQYTYAPTADWPRDEDATLSFFAYYPHSTSPDAQGSITPTRGAGANQWMKIAYSVSNDAGKHIDLMYAKTVMTPGYDPVNLNFGHALARLKFEGRTEGYPAGAVLKITGIKVKGATLKGELVVLDPTTQPGKPFWELSDAAGDRGDITIPMAHIKDNIDLNQTLQSVITTGGDMLILPQQVNGLTVEVTASLNGVVFPQPFTFSLDGTPDWTMNEINTYEITLVPEGMHIAVKVNDWTTDPVNIIQDGQWWLSVNEDEHRFPASGGEFTLTAETNYNITTQGYPSGLQINASEIVYTPAVTSGNEWLTLTDKNGGVNGDLAREIKITAVNTTETRTAKIKVKAGNLTKIINVKQIYVPISYPAYPGVIGYDPERGDLNLEGRGVMVYFKYGGIIAMYAGINDDIWDVKDIAFNPTPISVTTAYDSFPLPVTSVESTVGPMTIDETFHKTIANARNGNGDPCRFIKSDCSGMTAIEVKAALDGEIVPDQGAWRLPTQAENSGVAFSPANEVWETQTSPSDPSTLRYGQTLSGLNNGTSPNGGWNFLPAAGIRFYSSGAVVDQGTSGYYWSSTPFGTNNGHRLYFGISSVSAQINYQSYGFPIRCVRQ